MYAPVIQKLLPFEAFLAQDDRLGRSFESSTLQSSNLAVNQVLVAGR